VRVVRAGGCAAAAGAKVLRAELPVGGMEGGDRLPPGEKRNPGGADFNAEAEAEPPGGLYCAWCGKAIEPRRRRRESFCGANCRAAAWKARTGWNGPVRAADGPELAIWVPRESRWPPSSLLGLVAALRGSPR
jgi:hypothetical protein